MRSFLIASGLVKDNPVRHRYEVFADGCLAGFATYRLEGDRVLFLHTAVAAPKGRGLAHELIRQALTEVLSEGKTAVSVCPFVAGVIERDPTLTATARAPAVQPAAAL